MHKSQQLQHILHLGFDRVAHCLGAHSISVRTGATRVNTAASEPKLPDNPRHCSTSRRLEAAPSSRSFCTRGNQRCAGKLGEPHNMHLFLNLFLFLCVPLPFLCETLPLLCAQANGDKPGLQQGGQMISAHAAMQKGQHE